MPASWFRTKSSTRSCLIALIRLIAPRVSSSTAIRAPFPQAVALGKMLESKGLRLDAVIELKVDEGALVRRMENRVAETIAAGGKVRSDDNPEAFKKRLVEYREKTAPLSQHYAATGELKTVDGMASVETVTSEINQILASAAADA